MNDLLSWTPPDSDRHGREGYDHALDYDRLNGQQRRVYQALASGCWMSLAEISAVTGAPEASASARIRDLKNMFHLQTEKRRRKHDGGTWEYRLADGGSGI